MAYSSRVLHRTQTPTYKIYVHGLFNPRPGQAAAYPGRGVLGWAYPNLRSGPTLADSHTFSLTATTKIARRNVITKRNEIEPDLRLGLSEPRLTTDVKVF